MTAVAAMAMLALAGCRGSSGSSSNQPMNPFDADLAFLRSHSDVVVLADPAGQARVAVAPKYQGRVMTSTTGGDAGPSFGWIGRAAIESGEKQPHMNVFGGEDRFWLGPEGGQYASVLQARGPIRPRTLADAGAVRLGALGCRQPVRDPGELSEADGARELFRHVARRSPWTAVFVC